MFSVAASHINSLLIDSLTGFGNRLGKVGIGKGLVGEQIDRSSQQLFDRLGQGNETAGAVGCVGVGKAHAEVKVTMRWGKTVGGCRAKEVEPGHPIAPAQVDNLFTMRFDPGIMVGLRRDRKSRLR